MEQFNTFDKQIDEYMSVFLKKPTLIKGALYLVLILYAARVAPRPPKAVLQLFENQYFKLFFFTLILWTAQFSPSTSLLIALSFMLSMNYANEKALWEFMENTQESTVLTAPTKEVALETSAAVFETQVQEPQVVQTMTQPTETIVIQPTIVQTENGATVQNPNVVIAPAVVSNEDGQKLLVTPEVTVMEVPKEAQQQPEATAEQPMIPIISPDQQQAVTAVTQLAEAAVSAEPTSPQKVADLAQVATSAIQTTEGKEAVEKLAQQAVKPEAAAQEEVKETAVKAIVELAKPVTEQKPPMEEGCYPIRRYDMSQVMPFSHGDFHAI